MRYEAERIKLLETVRSGVKWSLLDCAGGAVSLRLGDGNILISTTGSSFRRWEVDQGDFVALTPEGRIVDQPSRLAASGLPLHLAIYRMFPQCGAIFHAHSPYVTAYSVHKLPIPASTFRVQALGPIPCLSVDEAQIKADVQREEVSVDVPEGMVHRPDVAAISILGVAPLLEQCMVPRAEELEKHGLAFTLHRHGGVTFARSIDEAFENYHQIEKAAQIAWISSALKQS